MPPTPSQTYADLRKLRFLVSVQVSFAVSLHLFACASEACFSVSINKHFRCAHICVKIVCVCAYAYEYVLTYVLSSNFRAFCSCCLKKMVDTWKDNVVLASGRRITCENIRSAQVCVGLRGGGTQACVFTFFSIFFLLFIIKSPSAIIIPTSATSSITRAIDLVIMYATSGNINF